METDSNGYIEEEGRSSSGVKGDQLGGMLVLTSSGLRRHDAGSARAGGKVKPDELRGSNASGSAAEAAFGLVGGNRQIDGAAGNAVPPVRAARPVPKQHPGRVETFLRLLWPKQTAHKDKRSATSSSDAQLGGLCGNGLGPAPLMWGIV